MEIFIYYIRKVYRYSLYLFSCLAMPGLDLRRVNMANGNQKLDFAFSYALNIQENRDLLSGSPKAGYDETEDRWRVIIKYYGDLDTILSGIRGVAYTGLFNNYAVVSVPASELDALADTQGIVYVEKPKEVYYNVNNGRAVSCINSVQEGSGITGGETGLKGNGVLIAIIDSGERVIILLSQKKPSGYQGLRMV